MKKLIALTLLLVNLGLAAQDNKNSTLAPMINAQLISGKPFNLNDYIGKKPVYLKFWATWCSYCKEEMPHLQSLENSYGDDVEIITINVGMNDSIKNINALFSANNYQLETIFDENGDISTKYGIVGTPHHVLIDREGKIIYRTFLATDKIDDIVTSWVEQGK